MASAAKTENSPTSAFALICSWPFMSCGDLSSDTGSFSWPLSHLVGSGGWIIKKKATIKGYKKVWFQGLMDALFMRDLRRTNLCAIWQQIHTFKGFQTGNNWEWMEPCQIKVALKSKQHLGIMEHWGVQIDLTAAPALLPRQASAKTKEHNFSS